jgi:hypothetical protein
MMEKPKTKRHPVDDKEQSKLFIEKAREIGADEEKSTADELIGRLAKMKPKPRAKGGSQSATPKPVLNDEK